MAETHRPVRQSARSIHPCRYAKSHEGRDPQILSGWVKGVSCALSVITGFPVPCRRTISCLFAKLEKSRRKRHRVGNLDAQRPGLPARARSPVSVRPMVKLF